MILYRTTIHTFARMTTCKSFIRLKTAIQVLSFCLLFSLLGCQEDDMQASQSEVDRYVARLQSGQYEAMELPAFTLEAIPALLTYRNSTEIISSFPRNPISSFHNAESALGMYILWTIESIRQSYVSNEGLPGRFPSLNPRLAKRDAIELNIADEEESQQIAAQAYYEWWENSSRLDTETLMQTDPLEDTDYYWH